jgi:putative oxidoreductase
MKQPTFSSWEPYTRSLLRIITGFVFSLHGFQKLFGAFGGMGRSGATAALFSQIGVAGVLECFGGLLILLGLFTRPVAFILCGEMAVAYFTRHLPRGFWPIVNAGELAVIYCFIFLYFFTAGAGPWSADSLFRKTGVK